MLVVLSPLFLLIALAIYLEDHGPVIFRQKRMTVGGKEFTICKFRTMKVADSQKKHQVSASQGDSRITRVGKLVRKCRLDEISQLIDVLRGTMTFVGTRPEVPKYTEQYTPEMMATLLLPAGVTSIASILYKDEDQLLDGAEDPDRVYVEQVLPAKMRYNLYAIEHFSFFGDIGIMFKTVFAVLGKTYPDPLADKQPTSSEKQEKQEVTHHD